jgi:hypothetical protein
MRFHPRRLFLSKWSPHDKNSENALPEPSGRQSASALCPSEFMLLLMEGCGPLEFNMIKSRGQDDLVRMLGQMLTNILTAANLDPRVIPLWSHARHGALNMPAKTMNQRHRYII